MTEARQFEGSVRPVGSVTVSMRTYLSSHHLWGARAFAGEANEIEQAHEGRSVFNIRHRALVMAAVLESVAFLEAALNEFFEDVASDYNPTAPPIAVLTDENVNALRRCWREGDRGRNWSVTRKAHEALLACERPQFDIGQSPCSTVRLVLRLRHRLMHFLLESRDCHISVPAPDDDELLARLHAQGFALNRLMAGAGNPFFPDHCLGAGCAQWSVTACVEFADEFFSRIGYAPNYMRVTFNA